MDSKEEEQEQQKTSLMEEDTMVVTTPPSNCDPTTTSYEDSSELEKVLSDDEIPYKDHIRRATWIELRLLFKLSAPAILLYLINNSMSQSTRIFSSQLGNLEFAAASLSSCNSANGKGRLKTE